MKKTITKHEFTEAFQQRRPNQFSYEGLQAMFDYFEEYEESTGSEIEFDVIGICCEYTEYENLKEFQRDYGDEYKNFNDIEYYTEVIYMYSPDSEKFIIRQF